MNNNPFGEGASGGTWIANLNGQFHRWVVVGINSKRVRREANVIVGPYFDDKVPALCEEIVEHCYQNCGG